MQDRDNPAPPPFPDTPQNMHLIIIIIIINNQAKYTIYNILKMFTNYRIKGNSIYKDEC